MRVFFDNQIILLGVINFVCLETLNIMLDY